MEKDIKNIDLNTTAEIFGYARISVDIEKEDDKNTSIENREKSLTIKILTSPLINRFLIS